MTDTSQVKSKSSLKAFKRDQNKNKNGVEVELSVPGMFVTVLPFDNTGYSNYISKQAAINEKKYRNKSVPAEETLNILAKAVSEHILVGWRGWIDDNCEEIPFSKSEAFAILSNPDYKDLLSEIISIKDFPEIFREYDLETIEKN